MDSGSIRLSRRDFACLLASAPLVVQGAQSKMFGDAEAYDQFMGRWSTLLAPAFVEFSDIRNEGQVLDVGSGTGSLAFAIAKAKPGCRIVGIDPSKEYIAYAKHRTPAGVHASFEVGDAQQLRFGNATFDHCLSLLVVNFIPDPAKALRELVRVTKPRGHIAAAVWDYGEGMRMLRVYWDATVAEDPKADKVDEKHMPLCRAGELSALWKKSGLTDVVEQPIDITMRYSSFADYWNPFLLGQGPAGSYVRSLPRARVESLRAEVKRLLNVQTEKAPFELPARVWAVRGTVS